MNATLQIEYSTVRIVNLVDGETLCDILNASNLFISGLEIDDFSAVLFIHSVHYPKPIYIQYEKQSGFLVFNFGNRD